jgi:DNA-binding CsgD family transcriptional regulator
LERLIKGDVKRVGVHAFLSPKELSVLRQASNGLTLRETAKVLGLGEETALSHFKKAQAKLGTQNRTHTVAVAMRQLLIV